LSEPPVDVWNLIEAAALPGNLMEAVPSLLGSLQVLCGGKGDLIYHPRGIDCFLKCSFASSLAFTHFSALKIIIILIP
jgi:hypothetical protein